MSRTQILVNYFCQRGYFQHVVDECKKGQDPITQFWHGFALTQTGQATEAIRVLSGLAAEGAQGRRQTSLAVTAALIAAHKQSRLRDKEAISGLKERLREVQKTSDPTALLLAAAYFWHTGKHKQARQCAEKVAKEDSANLYALSLLGYINHTCDQAKYQRKASAFFDKAISSPGPDGDPAKELQGLLGRAAVDEHNGEFGKAIAALNEAVVHYPWFGPGLVEKARLITMTGEWDKAVDTANRVLHQSSGAVDALRILATHSLALGQQQPQHALDQVRELCAAIRQREPNNADLCLRVAKPIARLAYQQPKIIAETLALMQHAVSIDSESAQLLCELAHQTALTNDHAKALELYSNAAVLDDTNMDILTGSMRAKLALGQLDEAAQEYDFIGEVQQEDDALSQPELLELGGRIAWHKHRDEERALKKFRQAIDAHMAQADEALPGIALFSTLDVSFVLRVVSQLLSHAGTEPLSAADPPSPLLQHVVATLDKLVASAPGIEQAMLMLAKAKFISGQSVEAESALTRCIRLNPHGHQALMLKARIALHNKQYRQADTALNQASSLHFEVQQTPEFHIIRGRLLEYKGNLKDALAVIERGIQLKGVRKHSALHAVHLQDRIQMFLSLANLLRKLDRLPEASKVMQDARHEFEKTSESARIVIADADLAISARHDVDAALAILRTVSSESVYYFRAKMRMADIFLKHRRDVKKYAKCFEDLVVKHNTIHTYCLLGEAYMKIQEPDRAISAFKRAHKLDPSNPQLTSTIGRALVTTHDYALAVQYYEAAIEGDASRVQLHHELAQLYIQFTKFETAENILKKALQQHAKRPQTDADVLIDDVKTLLLLCDVYQAIDDEEALVQTLQQASATQKQVLTKVRDRERDFLRNQKNIFADICFRIGDDLAKDKQTVQKAQSYFAQALQKNDAHEPSLLALARLHLKAGELEACQQQCLVLMRIQPGHSEASMMLADLMFRKQDHDSAIYHFQQLLERNPTQYTALRRLIELLRQSGKLKEAPKYLKLAEHSSARAQYDAGLHFCKGLHDWYATNDPREALKQFNQARKQGAGEIWGRDALRNMIEIYLNPDNEQLFADAQNASDGQQEQHSGNQHIQSATRLLSELGQAKKSPSEALSYTVLEAYVKMASKQPGQIEEAIQLLTGVVQKQRDHVPALLAMAFAFKILDKIPKCRNNLKRIQKMQVTAEWSNEFQRAWLLLADLYIETGKFDLAEQLCQQVLKHNESSSKAYEHIAMIREKEKSYKDAAEFYEKAWIFQNKSSTSVGFKLAFNYLKAKRYVEAVDICHRVLELNPDYPQIRKQVLDKARDGIRP